MDYQSGTKLPHSIGSAIHGPIAGGEWLSESFRAMFPILQR
jgi:hypothetical protein